MRGLSDVVATAARRFGSAAALDMFERGERFTFEALAARVSGLADTLRESGVRAGDRVGIALDNRSDVPLLTCAAAEIGAATFTINPGFTPAEVAYVLEKMTPRMLVGLPGFCSEHVALLERLVPVRASVDAEAPGARLFVTRDGPADRLGEHDRLDDIVSFAFSSGSTGFPKAVPRRQRQWMAIGTLIARGMSLTPEDRMLTAQPLYYGDPFYCLMGTLLSGACMVMLGRFRSQTFLELLSGSRATKFLTIGVVPTMLLNTPPSPLDRGHALKAAWVVGIPREIHAELERRFGCPWYEVYGTAETATVFMETPGREGSREVGAGWLGDAVEGVEVRLISDGGSPVSGDGEGLLEVRSPLVMPGYYKAEAETAQVIGPDGWYRTGDRFERLGGRYRFLRREKDIVRRSGENVAATEVEAALRSSPLVLDAAVLPRPDPVRGEEIWAFLMPAPGRTVSDLERRVPEILRHAAQRLARHKVPRFVSVLESFPRTASEKTVKRDLPAMAGTRVYDREREGWLDAAAATPGRKD